MNSELKNRQEKQISFHVAWIMLTVVIFVFGTEKAENFVSCVISVFRREGDERWALLGYYEAHSGNSLQTFRYKSSVPSSRSNKPS